MERDEPSAQLGESGILASPNDMEVLEPETKAMRWSVEATTTLVDARYSEEVLSALKKAKNSMDIRRIWKEQILPAVAKVRGFEAITVEQAQKKASKMVSTYKEYADRKAKTGSSPSYWQFYDLMHRYLHGGANINPRVVIDSTSKPSSPHCVGSPPEKKSKKSKDDLFAMAVESLLSTGKHIEQLLDKLVATRDPK